MHTDFEQETIIQTNDSDHDPYDNPNEQVDV